MRQSLSHGVGVLSTMLFSAGCASQPRMTQSSSDQLAWRSPDVYINQFEATELARCIDEKGMPTGTLMAIWRIKNSSGESVVPYIQSFAGRVHSLKGDLIEFQSLHAVEDKRVDIPTGANPINFPRGSYSAYKLQFLDDELRNGLAVLRINGKSIASDDFTQVTLSIPRFALGGQYATRYYLRGSDGQTHELSCQAVSSAVRSQLTTFAVKDGLHGFAGSRGTPVELLSDVRKMNATKNAIKTASKAKRIGVSLDLPMAIKSELDLRPVLRPKSYDQRFKHTRLFECPKDSAVDAIWRIADDNGKSLAESAQFITGFSAVIRDKSTDVLMSLNAVRVDPVPAFYVGQMPSDGQFFFPALEFGEDEFKSNVANHSQLPKANKTFRSGGGSIFIPRDGSGRSISVALSQGPTPRGEPAQVIADCIPVRQNISDWLNHCVGRENRGNAGTLCQP